MLLTNTIETHEKILKYQSKMMLLTANITRLYSVYLVINIHALFLGLPLPNTPSGLTYSIQMKGKQLYYKAKKMS